jgi:hypothetical protein
MEIAALTPWPRLPWHSEQRCSKIAFPWGRGIRRVRRRLLAECGLGFEREEEKKPQKKTDEHQRSGEISGNVCISDD